ncbi:ornithine cyclodeaminase family protein [Streptomyces sp. NPDC058001]|uniref:ornithine cyclodeaminase family protein n=1 Tax=Streptomyces sp. NPDC058001 TaxID=3346300 RepID=UPI0036E1E563
MLFLNNEVTSAVLTMPDVVRALEQSYRDLATGVGVCRPIIDLCLPVDDERVYQWGTMEGGSARSGYVAVRMKSDVLTETGPPGARTQGKYCVRPGAFCGLILLLDARTGEPLALLNDGVVQHLRVGADSAIGAGLGAREDARVLGLFGSGGVARSHVEAFLTVRPLERVQVYSPTRAHRERFAAEMSERHGIEVVALDTPDAVHEGADIVAGCTDAVGDVVLGRRLHPGTHVTYIGGRPDAEALDRFDVWLRLGTAGVPDALPSRATKDEFVTYRAQPDAPVWQRHTPDRGRRHPPRDAPVVHLDAVLAGRARARDDDRQVTFSERGNIQGAQFHAVAAVVYEHARERGLGHEIPQEWLLQDIRD